MPVKSMPKPSPSPHTPSAHDEGEDERGLDGLADEQAHADEDLHAGERRHP